MLDKDFFSTSSLGGSQFFGKVCTRFWIDVWVDKVSLKLSFHERFEICSYPNALLEDMEEGVWLIYFRRESSDQQIELWKENIV
jgi:hypothetical protein